MTGEQSTGGMAGGGSAGSGMSDLAGQTKQAVTETAQQTMETAKSAAQEIAGTAQEQATQAIDQVVSQTTEAVAGMKEQAGTVFTEQRDRAVMGLTSLAEAFRQAGQTLADQASDSPAGAIGPFVDQLASRLEDSADFLKGKDVKQLVTEAETMAKRQPMLFAGVLFSVGVVGARLLKGTMGAMSDSESSSGQTASSGGGSMRSPGSTNSPSVGATWSSGSMSETGSASAGDLLSGGQMGQNATLYESSGAGAGGNAPYRTGSEAGSTAGDWGGVDVRPETPELSGEPS